MARGQSDELIALATEERIGADNDCVDSRLDDGSEGSLKIVRCCMEDTTC